MSVCLTITDEVGLSVVYAGFSIGLLANDEASKCSLLAM